MATIFITIHDESITIVCNPFLLSKLLSNNEQLAYQLLIVGGDVINRCDDFIGDNEDMAGGLWIDIPKSGYKVILKDDISRDFMVNNFGEQLIGKHNLDEREEQ